ncbi:reverse transcriptase family protein [Microbulbifer halophilus]|uniref:RNA-directed DNA polymerase n=1 Tax=Microbulbifer halophilus TaxID=453963 RepID=A0ABW5EKD5_9GAMM|nr:reverse transcriptase family protein [Microbulbifer halophilus]MCW8128689.1 reverse transcriptase family protein [Microbulbifer halophilus]
METWSVHQLSNEAQSFLDQQSIVDLRAYVQTLKRSGLPVIFTLRHLSKIVGVDYSLLRTTVERRRESSNYRMFAIKKRSGGRRHIHTVTGNLLRAQQFINEEILQKINPHPASFAFHSEGGIRACASMHCGAKWMFQYDLANFFYSVNEADVYRIFLNLGYRPLLAFELARVCTTLRLPKHLMHLIKIPKSSAFDHTYRLYQRDSHDSGFGFPCQLPLGVLPQGASASPMLSNLAARSLDQELTNYADQHGLVYTRYADDLTLSSSESFDKRLSIGSIHRSVIRIIRKNRFLENRKKTRVAGPGSKKIVLGLLVDSDKPRLSKEMYKRIDRHIYAIKKYGLIEVSRYENFDSPIGFYNHLAGLISFVKDVDAVRWDKFRNRFREIDSPVEIDG